MYIKVNKNRGWRGLAEIIVFNDTWEQESTTIFSFSADLWDLMINKGIFVVADDKNYQVLKIDEDHRKILPIGHQRSVLIKNFRAQVTEQKSYPIAESFLGIKDPLDYKAVYAFVKNTNAHTQSDWNNIGVRVSPRWM